MMILNYHLLSDSKQITPVPVLSRMISNYLWKNLAKSPWMKLSVRIPGSLNQMALMPI